MSITNIRWLLMSVILLLIPFSGIVAYAPIDTPSNSSQEIIIVSLEDFDSSSADQLSQYILRLCEDRVNAQITIKKYVEITANCGELKRVIDSLSKKIDVQQVLHVIQEEKPHGASYDYFSITVSGPEAIQ